MPYLRKVLSTYGTVLSLANCAADRLTETLMSPSPWSCHTLICAHTLSSTHSPMALTRPYSSASGMKRFGGTLPSTGLSQRSSASAPSITPVRKHICGW